MLRPAEPWAIRRLTEAAHLDDRHLDTALIVLGVLPPLQLESIRTWLTADDVTVFATANEFGHRVLELVRNGEIEAWIDHVGTVRLADQRDRTVASA